MGILTAGLSCSGASSFKCYFTIYLHGESQGTWWTLQFSSKPAPNYISGNKVETLTPLYYSYYNARHVEPVMERILNVKLSGLLYFHIISTAMQGESFPYCTLEALANAQLTALVWMTPYPVKRQRQTSNFFSIMRLLMCTVIDMFLFHSQIWSANVFRQRLPPTSSVNVFRQRLPSTSSVNVFRQTPNVLLPILRVAVGHVNDSAHQWYRLTLALDVWRANKYEPEILNL